MLLIALDLNGYFPCRSVCACMQTQHKVQLDARDKNPGLVMPNNPYMAPVFQQMGMAIPPTGPPPGYPVGPAAQQQAYIPPPQQPPPVAGGYSYGAPQAQSYPPPQQGYGYPPPAYPPPPQPYK